MDLKFQLIELEWWDTPQTQSLRNIQFNPHQKGPLISGWHEPPAAVVSKNNCIWLLSRTKNIPSYPRWHLPHDLKTWRPTDGCEITCYASESELGFFFFCYFLFASMPKEKKKCNLLQKLMKTKTKKGMMRISFFTIMLLQRKEIGYRIIFFYIYLSLFIYLFLCFLQIKFILSVHMRCLHCLYCKTKS